MKSSIVSTTVLADNEWTPRDRLERLASLLEEKERRMAYRSLYYFCKYVVGFADMEMQPHWELCTFIQKNLGLDQLILLPRGTFKSSVTSVGLPLWLFWHERNLRILLSSFELQNTKNFLGLSRANIERNDKFRRLCGDWVPSTETWHTTALSMGGRTKFKAEESLTASSIKVTKVSQHYDIAILDDLQTDKNMANREMINAIQDYLDLLLPILDPQTARPLARKGMVKHGPRIIVGTRWLFDDIYGRMVAKEQRRRKDGKPQALKMLIRRAYNKKRTSVYFPSRFSVSYLDDLQETSNMSRSHFSAQYLNDPLPEGDQVFKLKHFGFYNSTECVIGRVVRKLPKLFHKFTVLDPSRGETDDSDWSAFVTVAVDTDWNMFVWDVYRDRLIGNEPIIDKMFEIHKTHKPIRFGVESVLFQKSIVWGFKRACRARGIWFHVKALDTDTKVSKDWRISGFEPFVTNETVYLRVRDGIDLTVPKEQLYHALVDGQDALADEMLRFPRAQTKDCIDALSYMPQLIHPARGEAPKDPPDGLTFKALKDRVARRNRGLLSIGH